jgi:hypothetical protein
LEKNPIEPYPFFSYGQEWIKQEKDKAKKLKKTSWWRKKDCKWNLLLLQEEI